MKTREETAVEFCGLVTLPHGVRAPEADAPLHEHLAFTGMVAEALTPIILLYVQTGHDFAWHRWWSVQLGEDSERMHAKRWGGSAPDLSHAAMLAAISAKRGAL